MRASSITMLLVTVAAVSACTKGSGVASTPTTPSSAPPSPQIAVDVAEINGPYSFYPSPAMVVTSQTVVWRNRDTVTHHVVFDGNSIDTGTLAPGTLSQPMTIAVGTWNYHCSIHPTMVGSLTVTPS
jgi:plastocyanin